MDVDVSFFGALRGVAGGRRRTISLPEGGATVSDLRRAVLAELPALEPYMEHTAVGVGTELLADDAWLDPGVSVSLLPPVSGGGGSVGGPTESAPRVQDGPLSLDSLIAETAGVDDGALVVFSGNVRGSDGGRALSGLDYDVHREMAEVVIRRIEKEVCSREGVLACRIVHRVGFVPAGESSVYVVVRARHRPEGFRATRDGIDRVKAEAPIWKEDVFEDGGRAPHVGADTTPLRDTSGAAARTGGTPGGTGGDHA